MLSPADKKTLLLERGAPAPEAVEMHFRRLGSDYWNAFSPDEIAGHIATLQTLDPAAPWDVRVEDLEEGLRGLTLIGGDFRGFFAAVSGFLASEGYDVRSGRAFTFPASTAPRSLAGGGVLDFLVIRHDDPARATPKEAARLRAEMEDLFRRFNDGEAAAIRTELFRRIGERLEARGAGGTPGRPGESDDGALPPEIRVHAVHDTTRLVVRARDREGMLFCMAGALSLRGLSLVTLLTDARDDGFFENTLVVTGPGGAPVRDAVELEKIRAGIALMERLLRTLPGAVDLQAAAEGLQALVDDWLEESSDVFEPDARGAGREYDALPALSRVLTAGPRLWEAVDRIGPRAFRRMLGELSRESAPPDREAHARELATLAELATRAAESKPEARARALRDYRDREVLKAELDVLLTPSRDWRGFAARLCAIAEACLAFALDGLRAELAERHGEAGSFALMALGKFGGGELGSGSDLEIVLVHADGPETTGPRPVEPVRRGEFHGRLLRDLARLWAVPEGATFALDLRLRPHGESGPLASSFAAWEEYYRPGGAALDYERQALIRLRAVHGDGELCDALLAARDAIAYADPPVPIEGTLELFARQAAAKERPGLWNAKLGRGGLAELEYGVQFLQLRHGHARSALRQHEWIRALEALLETGVISLAEFEHLFGANLLLRRLVNALRLARGHSKDLYCPPSASPEFAHLARRLGYVGRTGEIAESRLARDLARAQNVAAGFFRHRFLGGPRPEWLYESLAEALMDPDASPEDVAPALERLGMRDLPAARALFLDLFDALVEKRLAAACLLNAEGIIHRSPDPDGVLRHLVRYLRALDHPDLFIRQALHHPPLLERLLLVFANSDPLSDLAVREGDAFKTLIEPESLDKPRLPEEYRRAARAAATDPTCGEDIAARLCRLRDREYLRIALRDLHLNVPLREITYEISGLSDALIATALDIALESAGAPELAGHLAVIAMGKLGGAELNYSSDIDLVFVMRDEAAAATSAAMAAEGGRKAAERACRALIALLTRDTAEGRLFRVDMKLRPWGGQGPLAGSVSQYRAYFAEDSGGADGWELQAWLKARTVCGPAEAGDAVIAAARAAACAPENAAKVVDSMRRLRLLGLDKLRRDDLLAGEVKLGPGGIRTVEFFTQALQIRHAARIPELLTGNTLEALGRLNRYGLLPWSRYQLLTEAYIFLRRVEHRLQLQGYRQRHAMPTDAGELDRLARQMGYEDRVGRPARDPFLETYRKHMLSLQPVSEELFGH